MSDIRVMPLEPDHFSVEVREGTVTRVHKVAVPPQLLDDLGLAGIDQAEIVHETFAFLLDREPGSAILGEFALDQVASYFPDFYDELKVRLRA